MKPFGPARRVPISVGDCSVSQLMRPIKAAPIGAVGLAMRAGMGLLQRAGNRRCPDGQIARRIGQQAPA